VTQLEVEASEAEEVAETTVKSLMAADLHRQAKVAFKAVLLQDGQSSPLATAEVDQGFLAGLFTAVGSS